MPNTTEGSHHEFHGGKKLTSSYFFQTPRLRSQQYRHKAKSGQAIIDRSWFKAPKQANAHNSTGYKFIAVVLWVRKPDSCSYSGLVPYWHNLVDDILDCSSSRDCVEIWGGTCRNLPRSVLEMWYVFVDSFCFRCQKQKKVLLQFSSGSVEARIVYLARVSTCPCSGVLLNSVYLYRVSLEACWGKQAQDERSVEEDEVDE